MRQFVGTALTSLAESSGVQARYARVQMSARDSIPCWRSASVGRHRGSTAYSLCLVNIRTRLSTAGDGSFPVTGPRVCNPLPQHLTFIFFSQSPIQALATPNVQHSWVPHQRRCHFGHFTRSFLLTTSVSPATVIGASTMTFVKPFINTLSTTANAHLFIYLFIHETNS